MSTKIVRLEFSEKKIPFTETCIYDIKLHDIKLF